jgi:hypothetical protein
MGFDVCGVDHLNLCRSATSGKLAEQQLPDAALRPPHEAVIDRLRRAIFGRAIAPTAAALNDEHDPANHAAVAHSFLTAHICRQKRFYPRPLFIVEPEKIRSHRFAPNQHPKRISNRFTQQSLYWVRTLIYPEFERRIKNAALRTKATQSTSKPSRAKSRREGQLGQEALGREPRNRREEALSLACTAHRQPS